MADITVHDVKKLTLSPSMVDDKTRVLHILLKTDKGDEVKLTLFSKETAIPIMVSER